MIKTQQTDPDHHTVGHYFGGHSFKHNKTQIYFCDSYDPAIGYWLTNIEDPTDRKNVSERAIGRTFHEAEETLPNRFFITNWGVGFEAKVNLVVTKPLKQP